MSKQYQSSELRKTAKVKSRLGQLGESSAVSPNGGRTSPAARNATGQAMKTYAVTYRNRLYKMHSKALPPGTFDYAVVRDTLEHPINQNLPTGELIFEANGSSRDVVRLKTKRYRDENLGRVNITDWRNFGSI